MAVAGALPVVALHSDVVAEESSSPGPSVRDQGLVLRQIQREIVAQERRQALFDLLGFGLGSDEPEQVVVGVADISQPPIARIVLILAGQALHLLAEPGGLDTVAAPASARERVRNLQVGRVAGPARASGVFRNQNRLDELVQLVQLDRGQDR